MSYSVYIVRCADGTFYTGIATDVQRRIEEHNTSPKGARYTRSRRPVTLVWEEKHPDRSSASKREHALKKMSREAKRRLIETTGH